MMANIFSDNSGLIYKYTKLIWKCLQFHWLAILSLGIWISLADKSQANQIYKHSDSSSKLLEKITSINDLEQFDIFPVNENENHSITLPYLIAAPENFNPSLQIPPPLPELPKPSQPSSTTAEPEKPLAVLENIQTDFRNDTDNFGIHNLFIEPTFQFRLPNGNKIFVKTGFNFFEQIGIESISNIPIQIGWQGKVGDVKLQTAAGVDIFNRLPPAINLNAQVEALIIPPKVSDSGQLLSGLIVSVNVEQGPYKFNAQTLENQITAWRFGPNLYWQIDRDTSLFSSLRLGNYSDRNSEVQSFSRLERKFGQFSLAANLFTWSYDRNLERTSGYFSPPDFFVYNAEVAWEGEVVNFLRCRLSASLGQQRLNGEFDNANAYQTRCTAKLSPSIEADLGYSFSNVRNQDTGGSAYGGNSLTGQLRVKF
ncbi:hypothetical protein NIES2100_29150 [Calothrix sp. NIES-2100]|uniref:cellulose synthase subunit BcsC-related outer membrane protein n=1 Tax=Calothrix sp. NIES-2100 TaxID=1954172 RepID=UPI000B5F0A59|nr:hypothetical protein NIES2100_29150 [Calothrix sp. NIES-2100]